MADRSGALGFALAALALLGGCENQEGFKPSHVGRSALEVRRDGATLVTGSVGSGKFEKTGTYVLVDVANPFSVAVIATLEGDLLDANGNKVGALNRDSLRIPTGAQRTFALVHHSGEVPSAVSADIRVAHTQIAKYLPTIGMTDAHVYQDGDRVVVAANLHNNTDKETIVVVIAGFYDASGKIMRRPHTVLRIPSTVTHPARFVGPPGSKTGYLFLGEQIY